MKTTRVLQIILLGVFLRIVFAALFAPSADALHFAQSAAIFARGGNIYVEQFYWNYSPALGVILAPLAGASFIPVWSILLSAVSLAAAGVISRLVPRRAALLTFALVWCNPLVVVYDVSWLQSDGIALLFLLLALYVQRQRAPALAVWTLCLLSVLTKHVTIFFVWILMVQAWGGRKAALRMIPLLALFALSFAPYLPAGWDRIVERVALYQSWAGQYGLGLFMPVRLNALIFYAVMLALPLALRHVDNPPRLLAVSGVVFFLCVQGISNQTFYLLILLAALWSLRSLLGMTFAALIVMLPISVLNFREGAALVWCACLLWGLLLILPSHTRVRVVTV